jgi:hypothetical protein
VSHPPQAWMKVVRGLEFAEGVSMRKWLITMTVTRGQRKTKSHCKDFPGAQRGTVTQMTTGRKRRQGLDHTVFRPSRSTMRQPPL